MCDGDRSNEMHPDTPGQTTTHRAPMGWKAMIAPVVTLAAVAAMASTGLFNNTEDAESDSAGASVTTSAQPTAAPLIEFDDASDSAGELTSDAAAAARDLSRAFAVAAEMVEPAVVHITTKETVQRVSRDMFGRIRRRGAPTERQAGLGSGVIVDAGRGLIVTNQHVINDGDRRLVRLYDGREFEAELLGDDRATDLAVLRIEADGLSAARFADSDRLSVGEWVLAVGSPFGFEQTVTAGIISAKGRGLSSGDDASVYEEFIQTDASINPGNSGGPLIDLEGRIVGINSAIISGVGQNAGLGFAIPSRIVQSVAGFIVDRGVVSRAYLGVGIDPLDPGRARALGLPPALGAVIGRVEEGGPADRAGLRSGDIVLRVGGRGVEGVGETAVSRFRNLIAFDTPGRTVEVELVRGERRLTLDAMLGDRDAVLKLGLVDRANANNGRAEPDAGFAVIRLTPAIARRLGLPASLEGEVVYELLPGSPAELAGVQVGDVIVAQRAASMDDGPGPQTGAAMELELVRGRMRLRAIVDLPRRAEPRE